MALDETRPEPAPAPDIERPPSGRIGRYSLLRPLARGGMGVVWEAIDPYLDRRVALKVLAPEAAGDGDAAARLLREARLAAGLSHPGIIRVHEVGMASAGPGEPEVPFLAMALLTGPTLADGAARLGRRERLGVLLDVARAVGFAHAAGVIHRDLKPRNVMLVDPQAAEGAGSRAIVLDFGLARALDAQTRLTRTGQQMGTVHYMAPEQVRADRDAIGPPTDVWALGVMLYELLCDRRPFEGPVTAVIYDQILAAAPVPPRAADARIERGLEDICLRALAARPRDRFADAGAFAAELDRALSGQPLTIRRRPWWVRARQALGPRGSQAVTLALAALLTVAIGALIWWPRTRLAPGDIARRAAAAGDWSAALAACERALARGPDAGLAALAERCRAELAATRAAGARQTAREASRRRLRPQLDAVARATDDLRGMWYVAGGDLAARIRALTARLDALEPLTRRPELVDWLRLWTVIGAGRRVSGDDPGAEVALLRAASLAPADGWIALQLGRLYLERSIAARLVTGVAADDLRLTGAARWTELAAPQVRRAVGRLGGASPLDRHLARAYVALATGDLPRLVRLCGEGPSRFEGQPGTEVYWMLIAFASRDHRPAALERALARRPHYPLALFMRGNVRDSAGDVDGALADYDRALALGPRLGPAWLNRGTLRMKRGQLKAAVSDFDHAVALLPELALAWCNRSIARTRAGDPRGGLADAERALALAPDFSWGHNHRGAARLQLGQLEGALADLRRALALEPTLRSALHNLAKAQVEHGQGREALALMDRAVALYPDDAETVCKRGMVRARTGDAAGALVDQQRALQLDPRLADALHERGVLHHKAGRPAAARRDLDAALAVDPDRAVTLSGRGLLRLEAGDLAGAAADLARALALAPDHAGVHLNLSLLHHRRKDTARALAAVDRAIVLKPRRLQAYVNKALILRESGQPRPAVQTFTRALRIWPDNATLWMERGSARREARQLAEAVADYDRAIALDPRMHEAWFNRGLTHEDLGAAEAAIRDYGRALTLQPELGPAWFRRGVLRLRQRQLRPALADLDVAVRLSPDDTDTRFARGCLRQMTGDWAGAADDMTRVIARRPGAWRVWFERARCRDALGRPAAAIADYTQAIALDARIALSYNNRGLLRRQQGDVAGALADFQQTVRVDPAEYRGWTNLGVTRWQQGRRDDARAAWAKARRHVPPEQRAGLEALIRETTDGR